jgi:hypothetical protein
MNVRILSFFTAILALALSSAAPAAIQSTPATAAPAPMQLAATKAAVRDLWVDHVFWVRNVVDARLAADTKRDEVAADQVVANARAIADAIEPFYAEAGADKLFELLAGHWGAISDYLDGTIAGKTPAQETAFEHLVGNAGEIAKFLSGANPNLPEDTLYGLLTAHGAHHVQQIKQLRAKSYAEEAATWSAMKHHMYVIADALVDGIAKQFPEKFR